MEAGIENKYVVEFPVTFLVFLVTIDIFNQQLDLYEKRSCQILRASIQSAIQVSGIN